MFDRTVFDSGWMIGLGSRTDEEGPVGLLGDPQPMLVARTAAASTYLMVIEGTHIFVGASPPFMKAGKDQRTANPSSASAPRRVYPDLLSPCHPVLLCAGSAASGAPSALRWTATAVTRLPKTT